MKGIAFVSVVVALSGLVLCIAIGTPRQLETGFISGIGILTQGEVGSAEDTKTSNKMSEEGKDADKGTIKGKETGPAGVGEALRIGSDVLPYMSPIKFGPGLVWEVNGGAIHLGDVAIPVKAANDDWFAQNGIKGNGMVDGHKDVNGKEVLVIVIRNGATNTEKQAALAHELPVALALLDRTVDVKKETDLVHQMGIDTADLPTPAQEAVMDSLTPDGAAMVVDVTSAVAVPLLAANVANPAAGVMVGAETGPIDAQIARLEAAADKVLQDYPADKVSAGQVDTANLWADIKTKVWEPAVNLVATQADKMPPRETKHAYFFEVDDRPANRGFIATWAPILARRGHYVGLLAKTGTDAEEFANTVNGMEPQVEVLTVNKAEDKTTRADTTAMGLGIDVQNIYYFATVKEGKTFSTIPDANVILFANGVAFFVSGPDAQRNVIRAIESVDKAHGRAA